MLIYLMQFRIEPDETTCCGGLAATVAIGACNCGAPGIAGYIEKCTGAWMGTVGIRGVDILRLKT